MIHEIATITIDPAQAAEFEAAVGKMSEANIVEFELDEAVHLSAACMSYDFQNFIELTVQLYGEPGFQL